MYKRLFLLNGLAILGVVANHAAHWGLTALFWWTDRYRAVTVPNFDQAGSLTHWALWVIMRITVLGVPSFLFASGFFIAFSAKGDQPAVRWNMLRTRILYLAVPCVVWSVVALVVEYLMNSDYTLAEHLERLRTESVFSAYYFSAVLCQLLLISPFLAALAKRRWKLLLVLAVAVQLSINVIRYWKAFQPPNLDTSGLFFTSSWLFPAWIFYFALGIVFGFHTVELRPRLKRVRSGLLAVVVLSALMNILEPVLLNQLTRVEWRDSQSMISTVIYATGFVLWFSASDEPVIPFSQRLYKLSINTYGIYVTNLLALAFAAKTVYHVAPRMLPYQFLFQPFVFGVGLALPLLLMRIVSISPARRIYRYMFG